MMLRIVHRHNPACSTSLILAKLSNPSIAEHQPRYRTVVLLGYGRGKRMGFPTLNLEIPVRFPYPYGIYAGHVWVNEKKYFGAFHFGPVPTFKQIQLSLEVFLLHRRSHVRERSVIFQLMHYLRPIMGFPTPDLLSAQIRRDVELVETLLDVPPSELQSS